jgi:replication-associated recombination protein RarA
MENLTLWRPGTFADIIGKRNAAAVRCLQDAARHRRRVCGLLIGPYGTAKTSTARLLRSSYLCLNPHLDTADHCGHCRHCLQADADHNGEWLNYQHWEIDCTQAIGRAEISDIVRQAGGGMVPPFLFLDELPRLHEASAQAPLLKFVEDLKEGVFLAAARTEPGRPTARTVQILPALFDRLQKFYFFVPDVEEQVVFFHDRLPGWGVAAGDDVVREMVRRADRSFRTSLGLLEEARWSNGGRLDRTLLDHFLPPLGERDDEWQDPFASDES